MKLRIHWPELLIVLSFSNISSNSSGTMDLGSDECKYCWCKTWNIIILVKFVAGRNATHNLIEDGRKTTDG